MHQCFSWSALFLFVIPFSLLARHFSLQDIIRVTLPFKNRFFNSSFLWGLQVSSIVQVVGVILCLNAASKISHRAQGIGSLASRWHALATCSSGDASQMRNMTINGNLEATNVHISSSFYRNNSESDLESVDFMMMPTNTQLASSMTSYQKRQSLGMYSKAVFFAFVTWSQHYEWNNIFSLLNTMNGTLRPFKILN